MKKCLCMLIFGLLVSSTACFAASSEIRLNPYYLIPGDDDTWDNAIGFEAQYIYWSTPELGFAVAGGIAKWEVNEYSYADPDIAFSVDGSMTTIPVGASILLRPSITQAAEITFEGGIRYVFINSDIDFDATDYSTYYWGEVDVDDGVIGLLGVDIAVPLSPKAKIGLGAGYQFDISKGDGSIEGIDIQENKMKGFYLRLGLNFNL
jgi:hypothetical protein